VLIGNIIDLHNDTSTTLAGVFDALAAGVFLVDARSRIVFANAAGQDLLSEGHIVCGAQDVLTVLDAQADLALREAIEAASDGDVAVGVKGVAVALSPQPDQRWLAHILPLTSGARRRAGIAYAATAAVFVHKAALDTPPLLETIAKLYRLTPGELRVFAATVDVGGVSNVAQALDVSEATVKTHLQHLFEKTGMRSQVDLVKLAAGHASLLRG
jgi:DNA-binding NarL/FixJ family response regulator